MYGSACLATLHRVTLAGALDRSQVRPAAVVLALVLGHVPVGHAARRRAQARAIAMAAQATARVLVATAHWFCGCAFLYTCMGVDEHAGHQAS